jgi:uncharacterized iron-regulated protein
MQSLPQYYDTANQQWIDMSGVTKKMSQSDIVFVGEFHNHIEGHKIELELLKYFHTNVTVERFALSVEMFERDTQALLTGYLNNELAEGFFTNNSRPWNNYETDYKPLIEYMKLSKRHVIASNIPRRYAAMVSQGNENDLWTMPDVERSYMTDKIYAPHDRYYKIFYDMFKPQNWTDEKIELYYRAQCIKDDTMAMSIAEYVNAGQGAPTKIMSVTGSFHVDYHLGTLDRVKLRLPNIKTLLISIVPWNPSEPVDPKEFLDLADVVIFAAENPEN